MYYTFFSKSKIYSEDKYLKDHLHSDVNVTILTKSNTQCVSVKESNLENKSTSVENNFNVEAESIADAYANKEVNSAPSTEETETDMETGSKLEDEIVPE